MFIGTETLVTQLVSQGVEGRSVGSDVLSTAYSCSHTHAHTHTRVPWPFETALQTLGPFHIAVTRFGVDTL